MAGANVPSAPADVPQNGCVAAWVLHVDLDQFIAAVEVLRDPALRGRPVVVGGDGDPTKRGVVSTASYEAREFGITSGQPLRMAARRCPDAVFLPVDREAYEAASVVVMATLRQVGGVVEVLGWDEAFIGVETSDPEATARDVQRRVRDASGLDCTVGIGANKLQAKLATAYGKPAGTFRLTDANWFELLGDQPTDSLWGVGRKTAKRLAGLGISTVAELAATEPQMLAAEFGPTTGPWLVRIAQGRASAHVDDTPHVARSRSREVTFQTDLAEWADVEREVAAVARRVAADVAAEGRPAMRVVVKVRFAPFFTHTHGVSLRVPTADAGEIERAALTALDRFESRKPVRLVGVRTEFAA